MMGSGVDSKKGEGDVGGESIKVELKQIRRVLGQLINFSLPESSCWEPQEITS